MSLGEKANLRLLPCRASHTKPNGNNLAVTAPAVADEIAGGAELASGKFGGRPVVIVRGVNAAWLTLDDGPAAEAPVREEDGDLFGLGSGEAVIAALEGRSSHGLSARGRCLTCGPRHVGKCERTARHHDEIDRTFRRDHGETSLPSGTPQATFTT